MKILIGSDSKGLPLKKAVKAYLAQRRFPVYDLYEDEETAQPHVQCAEKAAAAIQNGEADFAVLICGTGMGVAITANKFKGIYAAAVESVYAAGYARKINDANVLCMGAFIMGETMACEAAELFLSTGFTEGFPDQRTEFLKGQKSRLLEVESAQMK